MNPTVESVIASISDSHLHPYLREFFASNEAGRIFIEVFGQMGWPVTIDHITIRCLDVEARAKEFLEKGYTDKNERIDYPDQGWWAKVYRKPGLPSIFIDQAYADERGKKSLLPHWVSLFGDRVLHHVAVRVRDIDEAIRILDARGVEFSGEVVGPKGTRLRQIFTASEVRNGEPYSVLELTERNNYEGFVPVQADGLMQSSVKTKGSKKPGKK